MKAHETERLSAYYDGALTSPERAAVEAHLRACDACADYLADLAALDEGARGLPAEAPAGYFEQFPSRVRARMKGKGARRWTPVWVGAAAAAVLLAVLTPHMVGEKAVPRRAARSSDELPRAGAPAPAPPATQPALDATTQAQPAAPPERLREAAPVPRVQQEGGPVPKKLETGQAPAEAKDDGAAFAPPPAVPPPPAAPGGSAAGALGGAPAAAPEPQAMTEKAKRQTAAEEADRRDVDVAHDEEQAARTEPKVAGNRPADKPAANEASAPAGRAAAPATAAGLAKSATTGTVEDARAARERWRAAAARDPQHAEEARYRIVEEGVRAWRLGGDSRDRTIAVADARAYLARPGEHSTRVRALLAELEP